MKSILSHLKALLLPIIYMIFFLVFGTFVFGILESQNPLILIFLIGLALWFSASKVFKFEKEKPVSVMGLSHVVNSLVLLMLSIFALFNITIGFSFVMSEEEINDYANSFFKATEISQERKENYSISKNYSLLSNNRSFNLKEDSMKSLNKNAEEATLFVDYCKIHGLKCYIELEDLNKSYNAFSFKKEINQTARLSEMKSSEEKDSYNLKLLNGSMVYNFYSKKKSAIEENNSIDLLETLSEAGFELKDPRNKNLQRNRSNTIYINVDDSFFEEEKNKELLKIIKDSLDTYKLSIVLLDKHQFKIKTFYYENLKEDAENL